MKKKNVPNVWQTHKHSQVYRTLWHKQTITKYLPTKSMNRQDEHNNMTCTISHNIIFILYMNSKISLNIMMHQVIMKWFLLKYSNETMAYSNNCYSQHERAIAVYKLFYTYKSMIMIHIFFLDLEAIWNNTVNIQSTFLIRCKTWINRGGKYYKLVSPFGLEYLANPFYSHTLWQNMIAFFDNCSFVETKNGIVIFRPDDR